MIASSIILGDTLIRTQIDSVAPLLPVRVYLTEHGARLALKAKADADAYLAQWKNTQQAYDIQKGDLYKTTLERNIAQGKVKQLEKALFWANFWKITLGTASAVLTTKLIFKP